MFACARLIAPATRAALVSGSRAYLRPLSSVVSNTSSLQYTPAATSLNLLPAVRNFQTTTVSRDIDSAAKFIGAGPYALGLACAALAIGNIFASLLASCARNPTIMKQLLLYAIMGFAFAESIGLFSLLLAVMILYA